MLSKLKRIAGVVAGAVAVFIGAWLVRLRLKSLASASASEPTNLPPAPPETVAKVAQVEAESAVARGAATATAAAVVQTLADVSDEQDGAKRRKMLADLANKT